MPRPYQNESDLHQLQLTTAKWIAQAGFAGRINPGDIALRLFNGMRDNDPREIIRLWEDDKGHLMGWAMLYPAWNSYEVQVHPQHRDLLEPELLAWAEGEILKRSNDPVQINVTGNDTTRIRLLAQRGYNQTSIKGTVATCSMHENLQPPSLPHGFTIRQIVPDDASQLVALINDSFGWNWTIDTYQPIMHALANYTTDLAVIAPDGQIAATCILLPDQHNSSLMFENVGTGSQFQKMGLAKALLLTAMETYRQAGFTLAMVPYHYFLHAASKLYASVGFRPTYGISEYVLGYSNKISEQPML